MRTEHYTNKCLRISDKTWEKLKDKRKRSGLSWNLFIVKLLENNEKRQRKI